MPERGGDRAQRHAGAGDERLEQHVARAQQRAVAAGGGVQAGLGERAAGLDRAGDALAERAARPQRDQRRVGVVAVALLQRRLQRPQRVSVHALRLSDQVCSIRSWPNAWWGASLVEREAGALVDAAGGVQDVVGPQGQRRVAARRWRGG